MNNVFNLINNLNKELNNCGPGMHAIKIKKENVLNLLFLIISNIDIVDEKYTLFTEEDKNCLQSELINKIKSL